MAQRYALPGGQKNLIQRISLVSFISIAVSTMSLLLVLSVFNGLEDLIKSLFQSFDPDIEITRKRGKTFTLDADLRQQIAAVPGVAKVVDVLEDNALLRYQDRQVVVKLKGVSDNFLHQSRLEPFLIEGNFKLKSDKEYFAILGSGVQYALSIPVASQFDPLQVFYPRNIAGKTMLPQQQLYRAKQIKPGGVFAVEKKFDEAYVIVPIEFAASLMGMGDKRTALEIQVGKSGVTNSGQRGKSGVTNAGQRERERVQKALKQLLPDEFQVLNSNEKQASLMQAIHIERLFVFLTFFFILLVASLNIFFILSMLVLDKRKDIAILYTLGATAQDIKRIFLWKGLLIALSGAALGMALAWGLSWLQETYGLVSLGAQTSLVEAYPIKRQLSDFVYTAIGVVVLTLLAAYRPAQLAARGTAMPQ